MTTKYFRVVFPLFKNVQCDWFTNTHFHYSLFQILRKEMAALVGDDDVYE